MQLLVDAPIDEVRAALAERLDADEKGQVSIDQAKRDPFDPDNRGEALTFGVVVTWVALSAVGGVIGNATHDGLKKVGSILAAKFGEDRVREEDDAPETEDTPQD